jgi:hypothetical protein
MMRGVYWMQGKCVSCLVTVERAYSEEELEFTEACSCGAAADTIKRVRVVEL